MKKQLLLPLLFVLMLACPAQAQKLSDIITAETTESNGMSPMQCTDRFLIKDDVNGYARVVTTCTMPGEKTTTVLVDYGLWKSSQGNFVGKMIIHFNNEEDQGMQDGVFNLFFTTVGKDARVADLYDTKAVKEHYEEELGQLQTRGAEGSETLYAEMPTKGTTVLLHIVLGKELKANKGVPKNRMLIGELVFNKATGKFTFVKK